MATLNLGRIKPVFRGAYAGGTAYVVDDIVTSGNETFICILASTGNATSNATYWTKLAAKGTDGTDGTDVGTTITTQGDILYRDGSGLQRLAKGTAAQSLLMNSGATATEWGTVYSDIVKIAHQDIDGTGASAYEMQNCFSAANDLLYGGYKLHLHTQCSVTNGNTYIRFMTGTNTEISGGTDYRKAGAVGYRQTDNAGNTVSPDNDGNGVDAMRWGDWGFSTANVAAGTFITADIMGDMYGGTAQCRMINGICGEREASSPNYIVAHFNSWRCENAGNITGLRFFTANGNFINGQITLWGLKK